MVGVTQHFGRRAPKPTWTLAMAETAHLLALMYIDLPVYGVVAAMWNHVFVAGRLTLI